MSSQHRSFLVSLGGLLLFIACSACYGDNPPDGTDLLQGVVAARLQTPPSSLKIHYVYRDPITDDPREAAVDFENDKRRFINNPKVGRSIYKSFFDGGKAVAYDPSLNDAQIRELRTGQNPALLFDPRLIGVSPCYFWYCTIDDVIPIKKTSKIETLGKDTFGSNQAWHVRMTLGNPARASFIDVWVDDAHEFRVYRYDDNGMQTMSYYENNAYPWLPSRVVGTKYDRFGHVEFSIECSILEAKGDVKLPGDTWTLAGLGLPIGAEVSDVRIMQRLGYWDGSGVKVQLPRTNDLPPISSSRRYFVMILIILLLVLPLLFWRSSRKGVPRT